MRLMDRVTVSCGLFYAVTVRLLYIGATFHAAILTMPAWLFVGFLILLTPESVAMLRSGVTTLFFSSCARR